jgi:hypothetical protein
LYNILAITNAMLHHVNTHIIYYRDEAAKKCKVSGHCLLLEAPGEDDELFRDEDTVLSSRMFQKRVSLEFNASCLDEEEDEDEDEGDFSSSIA